jgi:hypothetical protein
MARTTAVTPKERLSKVVLNEISFVGNGDNPEADVVLLKIKREPSIISLGKEYVGNEQEEALAKWLHENKDLIVKGDGDAVMFDVIVANREIRSQMWDLVYTLEDSISSIVNDPSADKTSMIQATIAQFCEAMTTLTKGDENMPLAKITKERDDAQAEVTALKSENATLKGEVETLKAKPVAGETCKTCGQKMPTTKEAAIDKSALSPALLAIVEKAEADSELIEKMQDGELTREYIGKAAAIGTVGKVEEIGDLLKSIAKKDKDLAGKVFDVLKAADARIKTGGLFKEAGRDNGDNTNGVTAADKITQKAKEELKTNPTLGTIEKAWTHVYDTDHELRTEYLAERK